jgi:hypothetical protein
MVIRGLPQERRAREVIDGTALLDRGGAGC